MGFDKKTYGDALFFLETQDNFLVTTHQNADGDAFGAALAIAYFLEKLGKRYQVVIHDDPVDPKYQFLWGWDRIVSYREMNGRHFDASIVVDVPAFKRMGDTVNLLNIPERCLKIDHHPIEDDFAHFNIIDIDASSTCNIIYELVKESRVEFDRTFAQLLLCGIMYDTGRFSFSNTKQRDFEIAAHLFSFGITPIEVSSPIFFDHSKEKLEVMGYGLSHMESCLDGKVNIIFLPREIMTSSAAVDLDELANYSSSVRGGEVGIFIREMPEGDIKISFRSKGKVDVNRIARKFGGGGHIHAAGCRVAESHPVIKRKILDEVSEQLGLFV